MISTSWEKINRTSYEEIERKPKIVIGLKAYYMSGRRRFRVVGATYDVIITQNDFNFPSHPYKIVKPI
jgi:hypothetical protein